MNHKYSTYMLISLFAIMLLVIISEGFESSDIDIICNQNNSFLYRFDDQWGCGQFNISSFNISINTTNTTYQYININESDPIALQVCLRSDSTELNISGTVMNASGLYLYNSEDGTCIRQANVGGGQLYLGSC